jgi:X-Pro dipeptidyl-peptidase
MHAARIMLVAALVALGGAGGAWPAGPEDREGLSKPIYEESVLEEARVPMRDGETLYVEIRRPVVPDGAGVPVILTLSPYNALGSVIPPDLGGGLTGDGIAAFFVPRGYARAIADVRGTRESSGCWDYGGLNERQDGYDLVEWLGTRPWSNGKVSMIGGSYEGTTANAAAVERPPHLATIVPIAAIDRWYDYAYINGVRWLLNNEEPTDEGFDTPAGFDFGFAVPPPIDARAAEWPDVVIDRYRVCDQVEHTMRGYSTQPDYDAFWEERDYRMRADQITIPILVGHGLDDFNVKATGGLEMFRRARGPKRMVLGQWPHAGVGETATGSWENLLWRWFDQWLLGLPTGVMDEEPVHVQDASGTWHREATWPPANAGARALWPTQLEALEPASGDPGELSFIDDPTMTEERMMMAGADPGRVLYTSEPVTVDTRIAGEPEVSLELVSDTTSTHVAAYLADVAPDGASTRITRGFMNPRCRDGLAEGRDLAPGEAYRVRFTLAPADHVVADGHRIALAVAGSNAIWALPDLERATTTVRQGPESATRLTLPVVGAAAGPSRPAPPAVGGTKTVNGAPGVLPGTGVGGRAVGVAFLACAVALGLTRRRVAR